MADKPFDVNVLAALGRSLGIPDAEIAKALEPPPPAAPPPAPEEPKPSAAPAASDDLAALKAELAELKAWRERQAIEAKLTAAKLDAGLAPLVLGVPEAERDNTIRALGDRIASLRPAPPPAGAATEQAKDPRARLFQAVGALFRQ